MGTLDYSRQPITSWRRRLRSLAIVLSVTTVSAFGILALLVHLAMAEEGRVKEEIRQFRLRSAATQPTPPASRATTAPVLSKE